MTHHDINIGLHWRPIVGLQLHYRIIEVLHGWAGTQYMSGQDKKGEYADCIGFGCRVIDELRRIDSPDLARLPSDACFHSPDTARAAMRDLLRLYAPVEPVDWHKDEVEPLDIIITGPPGGGPGHLMLVGTHKNALWHCNRDVGVCFTGFGMMAATQQVFAVYRPQDKGDWA